MYTRQKNIQLGLWMVLILLVGGFLRFYQLGSLNLNNQEARLALDALHPGTVNGNTLTVILNSVLFWFMESSNGLARTASALAGCFLILTPLFFRKSLGDRGVILLSAGLALDSSLVALSRIVDGRILGILLFILTVGFFLSRKPIAAGMALGMFLLTGSHVSFIVILLGIAGLWTWISDREMMRKTWQQWEDGAPDTWKRSILVTTLLTFFLVGSSFGLRFNGISGAVSGWVGYLRDWITPEFTASLGQMGIAVLAYALFPLIFGIWGMIRAIQTRKDLLPVHFLMRWMIAALVLLLVFPGRQTVDLVWIFIPLWIFASWQIDTLFENRKPMDWMNIALVAFLCIMLCFIILNWAGVINSQYDSQKVILRWAVIGVTIVLIILAFAFVGYGWGVQTSLISTAIALGLVLFCFQVLGGAWKSMGLLPDGPQVELWQAGSYPDELNLLTETLDQLGEYNHGDPQFLEVVVVGMDEPSINWELRNYNTRTISTLNPGDSPEVVISRNVNGELWGDTYRGQDFIYRESVNWSLLLPNEWQKWLLHREVPFQQEYTLLWVRVDLFPGSTVDEQ